MLLEDLSGTSLPLERSFGFNDRADESVSCSLARLSCPSTIATLDGNDVAFALPHVAVSVGSLVVVSTGHRAARRAQSIAITAFPLLHTTTDVRSFIVVLCLVGLVITMTFRFFNAAATLELCKTSLIVGDGAERRARIIAITTFSLLHTTADVRSFKIGRGLLGLITTTTFRLLNAAL